MTGTAVLGGVLLAAAAAVAWGGWYARKQDRERERPRTIYGTVEIVHEDGSTTELGQVLEEPELKQETDGGQWPAWVRHGPTRGISLTADLNEQALRELRWELMEEAGDLPPEGSAERALLRHRVLYGRW